MNRLTYILLSWTWGIVMTVVGYVVAMVLKMAGFRSTKFLFGEYFVIGSGWGGVSFGPVSIVSANPSRYMLCHEYGHSIQNCYFGILFPFIVAIPSFVRFWWREYQVSSGHKRYSDLPPYDSIWFEGQATELGTAAADQMGVT